MLKDKIVSFILNCPKRSVFVSLFFLFTSLPGLFFIQSDYSYRIWYGENDPLLKRYDKYEKEFGNDDNILITVKSDIGIFNKKTLKIIHKLTKDIDNFAETSFVDSLSNFVYMEGDRETVFLKELFNLTNLERIGEKELLKIEKRAQKEFFSKGRLIDLKSKMTTIEAMMVPTEGGNIDYEPFILKLRSLIEGYKKKYPEHSFQILGNAQIAFLFKEIVEKDISLLFPLLFLIFTIVLRLILKRKRFIFLTYINILFSITSMIGLMGYLGFKITSITSIAPQMIFTIALADIIHLIMGYSFFVRKNYFKEFCFKSCIEKSLKKNFYPTLLTTITTSAGLLSFSFSKVGTVAELGVIIALGSILAWFYSYFFFSPSLLLFEEKWGVKVKDFKFLNNSIDIVHIVRRYHKSILILTFSIVSISLFFCMFLTIDMNPIQQFKNDHFFRTAHRDFKEHFNYSSSLEIVLWNQKNKNILEPSYLEKVEKFNSWALTQPEVLKTLSLLDIIKVLNSNFNGGKKEFLIIPKVKKEITSLLLFYKMGLPTDHNSNRFINFDNKLLRISFLTSIESSKKGLDFIKKINKKLTEFNLQGHVTGKVPLFHELTPYVFKTFWKSFLSALFIISIILVISLRSFSLGLFSLIPNLFPLFIGGAIYYLFDISLDMGSALIASFCLGISVDDTIHFLFDYKRNQNNRMSLSDNIEQIVDTTYPALFFTTVILVIGFSSFSIANYIPNIKFGVMVGIILLLALFFDFIILPSLLMLKKKKNSN